jgi:hypothetical protein
MPGGAVEPGESLAEAAVREVREETGLEMRLTRLVGVYSRPQWRQGGNHQILFAATPVGGNLQRFDVAETLDVRFFDPDALPDRLVWWHRRLAADAVAGVVGGVDVRRRAAVCVGSGQRRGTGEAGRGLSRATAGHVLRAACPRGRASRCRRSVARARPRVFGLSSFRPTVVVGRRHGSNASTNIAHALPQSQGRQYERRTTTVPQGLRDRSHLAPNSFGGCPQCRRARLRA